MKAVKRKWQFKSEKRWSASTLSSARRRSTGSRDATKINASDDFLRAVVDACVTSVAVLDESGNILYASKAWRSFQQSSNAAGNDGESSEQLFNGWRRVTDSGFDKETSATLTGDIRRILSGTEKEFHARYCHPARNQRSLFIHGAKLDLPGPIHRVLISHEPVTKDSENRLNQLLNTTKIMAWEGTRKGPGFTYVSEQAEKMLGYPVAEWYEPNFLASHIHADDCQWVLNAFRKQSRTAEQFDFTFRMLAKDGHVVWVQNLGSVEASGSMYGFMIDVSERKRALNALQDAGGRLIAAQEEERKRVARELHDDLNQRLALLSIELEQFSHRIKERQLRNQLLQMQTKVQDLSTDIHRLSYRLHPSKLDHLGLAAAVRSLCHDISQSGKVKVKFLEREVPSDLPKDITLCLFRIAQELLRNCVRHSNAQVVQVFLRRTANSVSLTVSDNGRGFDTKSDLMEKGLGFVSIKERLHVVGGQSRIFSKPHRGTCVNISVPLDREPTTGSLLPSVTKSPVQSQDTLTTNSLMEKS